jgi:hypothetical protein
VHATLDKHPELQQRGGVHLHLHPRVRVIDTSDGAWTITVPPPFRAA